MIPLLTSVIYSECVCVALVIQHAKLMCRIILPSVASLALPHLSVSSHKRHDSRKKDFLNTKYFTFSTNLSEIFFILKRIQGDTTIDVHKSSCKIPAISSDLNETEIFLTYFGKSLIPNLIKIRQMGAELFQVDRQTDERTDTTKL